MLTHSRSATHLISGTSNRIDLGEYHIESTATAGFALA
jgi:hypothetical protein